MMPQLSPETIERFRSADPQTRSKALAAMSVEAKTALLEQLRAGTAANNSPPDDLRSRGQVGWDQALSIPTGVAKGLYGMAAGVTGALGQMLSGRGSGKAQEIVRGIIPGTISSIAEPWITNARGINALKEAYGGEKAAPAPTQQEWKSSAENVGMQGASLLLPTPAKAAVKRVAPVVASKLPAAVRHKFGVPYSPAEITNSLATIITPGVKKMGVSPQQVAAEVQSTARDIVHEWGLSNKNILTKETSPNAAVGDLLHGVSVADRVKVAKVLGKKVEDLKPIPLELADALVRKAHAPIKSIMQGMGDVKVTAGQRVAAKMRAMAVDELDDAARNNLLKLADKAEVAETVGQIDALKQTANVKAGAIYDKGSPGAASDASLSSAAQWRELGDEIRSELYPELADLGVPGIAERGRFEARTWDARDGIYKSWIEAARAQAPADLQSWVSRFGHELIQSAYFPRGAGVSAIKKVLSGSKPLQDFNRLMQTSLKDAKLPSPATPVFQSPLKNKPLLPQQGDLLPSGAIGQGPLLEPPPGTSQTIGKAIFGVQQRADQAARRAPPPTIAGKSRPLPGAVPGAELPLGKPGQETFYPGKFGVTREMVPELDPITGKPTGKMVKVVRDYRNQDQLFSVKQSEPPQWNPAERTTYAIKDLQDMVNEISDYLRTTSVAPKRRYELMRDIVKIKEELSRRREARK